MENGKKYKIRHKSETQKKVRESVMVFLDEEDDSYIFSARPVAGTQTMPKSWVLSIRPAREDVAIYVNKLVKIDE